jgi:eukaryotic-like serine/threonine-protein kinase
LKATVEPTQLKPSPNALKMATCRKCGAKCFLPPELPQFEVAKCNKCGGKIMAPVRLRQFELIAPIASGGMGTVYFSRDVNLAREVAVKLMQADMAKDAELVRQFTVEAKACAALNHTNIIHIYCFDEWEGRPYLAMEVADKGSLDDRIEKAGAQPELDVLDIGIKVASALASALKHNLTHRDIKPGNILFNSEGEPKVVDFGLAAAAEKETNYDSSIFGTPLYVAPERVQREPEDFHADMYSLGATLYHAITGIPPFDSHDPTELIMAHVHTPPTPPLDVNPAITQMTSDVLLRSLAKRPEDRFGTYDEFIMALTAARSHLLVSLYQNQGE